MGVVVVYTKRAVNRHVSIGSRLLLPLSAQGTYQGGVVDIVPIRWRHVKSTDSSCRSAAPDWLRWLGKVLGKWGKQRGELHPHPKSVAKGQSDILWQQVAAASTDADI
jgi:hypothetical protein